MIPTTSYANYVFSECNTDVDTISSMVAGTPTPVQQRRQGTLDVVSLILLSSIILR